MNLDTLAQRAGDVTDPAPHSLLAGRHHLDEAITAAGARVTAVRRTRRPRRWGITALASAAAATAALLVVPLVVTTPASAEEVLLAAAEAAGQQADAAVGAEYWHVVSEVDTPDTAPFTREIWQARSGEGVLRDGFLAAEAAAAGMPDPALLRTESLEGPATFAVGGESLFWEDLEELPTDPVTLETQLRAMVSGHQSSEENELWESITGLLRESPASPALRRALWQVAANMPDVELLGAMTDSARRQGTAVQRDQLDVGWFRVVYILDPNDGTLLEVQNIDADGDVVSRQTQLQQGRADSAPEAQPPLCGPDSVDGRSC